MGVNGAWSSQLTIAQIVIIEGPTQSGLFVYSGTPGPGNPPIASVTNAATDPFGNAVQTGITSYAPGAAGFTQLAGGELKLQDSAGNNWAEVAFMQGGVPFLAFESAGSPVLLLSQTGVLVADSWHAIPGIAAAGWSTVAGQPVPSYRMLPDGTVEVTGSATHAGFGPGLIALSTALPGAYQPSTTQFVSGGDSSDASVQILATGIINALPPAAGTTSCRFNGTYPVNL